MHLGGSSECQEFQAADEPGGSGYNAERAVSRAIDLLADHLAPNARVTVLTGAGVSATSGVDVSRRGRVMEAASSEQLATPEAFARDHDSSGNVRLAPPADRRLPSE